MFKNPILNALGAAGYIILVVCIVQFLSRTMGDKSDTIGAPITFLSLLTLSVATIAYLFLYDPVQLLIDGKKKEAVNLFVQTISIFAGFTGIVLMLLLTGII